MADEASISGLLQTLVRERPPVAGIFHAAGVLDDAVLGQQNDQRIAAVLRPKIEGARLLDQLSRTLPIEHFVLFSSSSALVGSAGQANHAAANAYLDALAEVRRAEGLPAISIAWGAWAEIGAAARAGEGVARRGLLPMPPAAALEALGLGMNAEATAIGVLDVDWGRFLDRFPPGLVPPMFTGLAPAARAETRAMEKSVAVQLLRSALDAASEAERPAVLVDRVRTTVARILGLPEGTLPDPQAPLRELGLDSLMTIELRNALATACETRLPATLVFEHPTCAAIATHLSATVFAALFPAPAREDELDTLDTDDLARLLEQELGAIDAQLAASS